MDEKNIRKAKWFNYFVFAIVVVLILAILIAVILLPRDNQNLDGEHVLDGLLLRAVKGSATLVSVEGEEYYVNFDETLLTSFWRTYAFLGTEETAEGTPVLTVRLGELYGMSFYEGGLVRIYDGYAGIWQRSEQWYVMKGDGQNAIRDYVLSYGVTEEEYRNGLQQGTPPATNTDID